MNINEQFPSKYLKASDLQGRAHTMNIKHIGQEDLNGELKLIIYFEGANKGMVLNKTNAYTISALYGPETDNWIGQPIEVFQAMVNFQGQQTPALRVKAPTIMPQAAPQQNYAEASQSMQPQFKDAHTASHVYDERNPPPVQGNPVDLDDEIPF